MQSGSGFENAPVEGEVQNLEIRLAPVLAVRDLGKHYGPLVANDRVSLSLFAGEVHAILGENGAGKSTLITCLAGMVQPDGGAILIDGVPQSLPSPATALAAGIGVVYQHFTLVPDMTVRENLLLGSPGGFLLRPRGDDRSSKQALAAAGFSLSPSVLVQDLAMGDRQKVEIAKALYRGARVLLLDEPTSVLAPSEVAALLRLLTTLKERGTAIAFITHKLDEALAISDRVTVLRAGRVSLELDPAALREEPALVRNRITTAMFGKEALLAPIRPARTVPGDVLLELRDVTPEHRAGDPLVARLNLSLRTGEILGIAGVDGNGQAALAEVIAGQRRVESGAMLLAGRDISQGGVASRLKTGVGAVTDDRLGEGCIAAFSVADNAILKSTGDPPYARGIWKNQPAIDREAARLIAAFNIRAPNPVTPAGALSGGNLQKLLLARELARNPRVLVCNKPTAGLDADAARFVLETLRDRADGGMAIILISNELDDIFAVSDRIAVMANGGLIAGGTRDTLDRETVGNLMVRGAVDNRQEPPA